MNANPGGARAIESVPPSQDREDVEKPFHYHAFLSYSHAADGLLAPAIQSGLQQFAKPWNRLRAVRLFRDKTGMTANPGLWSAIVAALDSSRYFLLLASTTAANSHWVNREAEHWLAAGPSDKILIALTDGAITWDTTRNDFDWNTTNALPPALRGKFAEEPFWVDLRFAKREEHLSLNNPAFREVIADLSSALRSIPKDQLIGEDVRQHRKAVVFRRSVIAGLATLAIAAGTAALVAVQERNLAKTNAAQAVKNEKQAVANAKLAQDNETLAKTNEAVARKNEAEARMEAQLALARQLAAQSDQLRGGVPRLFMQSLLLAIEAHRRLPGRESDSALRAGIQLAPLPGPHLGPREQVNAVAISPDDRYVFTAGQDKTLRVFDRKSGRELARLVHTWSVNTLALNPDASLVVSGTGDLPHDVQKGGVITQSEPTVGEARVWDWRAQKELARLQLPQPVIQVAFVGNRDMLAATDSNTLKTATFDRNGGFDAQDIASLRGNSGWISSFSSDGTLVALRRPEEAEIIDLTNGNIAGRVKITSKEDQVFFSPDNKHIAVTGEYGDTRVLDWKADKLVRTLNGSKRTLFSPDGKLVAQIDGDNNARVSSLDYGELLGVMENREMLSGLEIDLAAFLPDSTALATTLDDNAVSVWRPRKKVYGVGAGFFELFRMAEDKVTAMTVSRDGRFLATADENGARVWELARGNETKRWLAANRFIFGRRYAVTGAGKNLRVIDLRSGAEAAALPVSFIDFVLSPDESRIAARTYNGVLELRRVPDLALIRRIELGKDIDSMQFTGDGRSILVAWGQGTITEIAVNGQGRVDRMKRSDRTYQEISPHARYFVRRIPMPGKPLAGSIELYERSGRKIASISSNAFSENIQFAPNEEFFVGRIDNKTLGIWDSASGREILRAPVDENFTPFAISPNSKYVATPLGPQIVIWDVATRKTVQTLDHFSHVEHIAFSPDSGNVLANCNTLLIWRVDDGELVSIIPDDNERDLSSFTPDGKYIVSQKDRSVGGATPYLSFKVWRPEDLIEEGCRRATRNLTDGEWRQYLHSEPKRKTCPHLP